MDTIFPICPVHEQGEGLGFGKAGKKKGKEVSGERPGVLQRGVTEKAPEPVQAALGLNGQGDSAGKVGESGF